MILQEAKRLQTPGRLGTGRCELELATTLKELAAFEDQRTYNDDALLNYANALRESEAIGNHRLAAVVENNLGFLLLSLGLSEESEMHLLRAQRFFEAISDMIRRAKPKACAAPPISFFINRIPLAGLIFRPPVSKQTPLPTKVT